MPKITDARIEELKKLAELKGKLKEKIEKKKGTMKKIRDAMEVGGTADIMLSSSTAALTRRRKETSTLTNEDLLESLDMTIERLEERFSKVTEELDQLKELTKSS